MSRDGPWEPAGGAVAATDMQALVERYALSATQRGQLELLLEVLGHDERAPTSVRERERALEVHVADALVALELEPLASLRSSGAPVRLADVGSGAGLPGAVLAVALPASEVSLVESERRKCEFIASLLARAAIANAHAVWARAEEWAQGRELNDVVTARALARQPVVLEYAAPLLLVGGHLIDWRAARETDEERAARLAAAQLGMELVQAARVQPYEGSREHHLYMYRKTGPTPPRFPRRAGVARRRPLT